MRKKKNDWVSKQEANKSNWRSWKKTGSSNEVIKKGFKNDRDSIPLEEQKKYLINLLKKGLLNFGI